MCAQYPGCGEPTSALNVTIPTDIVTRLTAEAGARGVTVADLVEEQFSHLRGRVCPVNRTK